MTCLADPTLAMIFAINPQTPDDTTERSPWTHGEVKNIHTRWSHSGFDQAVEKKVFHRVRSSVSNHSNAARAWWSVQYALCQQSSNSFFPSDRGGKDWMPPRRNAHGTGHNAPQSITCS